MWAWKYVLKDELLARKSLPCEDAKRTLHSGDVAQGNGW